MMDSYQVEFNVVNKMGGRGQQGRPSHQFEPKQFNLILSAEVQNSVGEDHKSSSNVFYNTITIILASLYYNCMRASIWGI